MCFSWRNILPSNGYMEILPLSICSHVDIFTQFPTGPTPVYSGDSWWPCVYFYIQQGFYLILDTFYLPPTNIVDQSCDDMLLSFPLDILQYTPVTHADHALMYLDTTTIMFKLGNVALFLQTNIVDQSSVGMFAQLPTGPTPVYSMTHAEQT
jgi:hypothetical protein